MSRVTRNRRASVTAELETLFRAAVEGASARAAAGLVSGDEAIRQSALDLQSQVKELGVFEAERRAFAIRAERWASEQPNAAPLPLVKVFLSVGVFGNPFPNS